MLEQYESVQHLLLLLLSLGIKTIADRKEACRPENEKSTDNHVQRIENRAITISREMCYNVIRFFSKS